MKKCIDCCNFKQRTLTKAEHIIELEAKNLGKIIRIFKTESKVTLFYCKFKLTPHEFYIMSDDTERLNNLKQRVSYVINNLIVAGCKFFNRFAGL